MWKNYKLWKHREDDMEDYVMWRQIKDVVTNGVNEVLGMEK